MTRRARGTRVRAHAMDVQAVCEVTHDFTGAMAVSIFCLVIFVALLVADGVLTWFALSSAVRRDPEAQAALKADLENLRILIDARKGELALLDAHLTDINSRILQSVPVVDYAAPFRREPSVSSSSRLR